MGTLEDQLKKWKQQRPSSNGPGGSSSSSSSRAVSRAALASPSKDAGRDEATRRVSTKKDPYPAYTLRRDDPVPSRDAARAPQAVSEAPPTDAELFARAVQSVERDVVLQKFDAGAEASRSAKGARGGPVAPPPSDEELFLSFVGDARTGGAASRTSTTRGGPAPDARLSLRGASGEAASRRLRAFLDDAVRAGAASVLVDIDDASDAALDVARGHAAVVSVRDAGPAHGGKGTRLVRFKA